jgi:hypothetical protein
MEKIFKFKEVLENKSITKYNLVRLLELFPYPSQCKSNEGKALLKAVQDTFQIVMYKNAEGYFNEPESVKHDLLYWLFILCESYVDKEVKEKICVLIAFFHFDSPFPRRMHRILSTLIDFTPLCSEPLSVIEEERIRMKLIAIEHAARNEKNRILFIDNDVVTNLLPFLRAGDENATACLSMLCETTSFTHKSRIVDTPGLLSNFADRLKQLLTCSESEFAALFGNVKLFGFFTSHSLSLYLCCTLDKKFPRNFEMKKENINPHAILVCLVHNIPFLFLRLLTNLLPKSSSNPFFFTMAYYIVVAALPLLSLFAADLFHHPDTHMEVEGTIDFLCGQLAADALSMVSGVWAPALLMFVRCVGAPVGRRMVDADGWRLSQVVACVQERVLPAFKFEPAKNAMCLWALLDVLQCVCEYSVDSGRKENVVWVKRTVDEERTGERKVEGEEETASASPLQVEFGGDVAAVFAKHEYWMEMLFEVFGLVQNLASEETDGEERTEAQVRYQDMKASVVACVSAALKWCVVLCLAAAFMWQ